MIFRRLFAGCLLAAASTVALAGPVLTISGEGKAASQAAEAAFLAGLGNHVTETFEGHSAGVQNAALDTDVGTFTMQTAGQGGLCDAGPYSCQDGLAVLDASTTPFSGRFAVNSSRNWLDSMDAQAMVFSPLAGVSSLGFYITDPNDAGGRLDVGGFGFDFDDIFGSSLKNGRLFYVTITNAAGLGDLWFYSNNRDDGYGLDDVTVARVPEPGTLALAGAGLLGLVVLRRRVRGAS